jgi:hypothetical protein
VGPHGGRRTMATAMINQCVKSHRVGKLVSWSYSSNFSAAAAAATHHSPMMLLPGQCGTMTIFGMEAAGPTALMPRRMLIVTSSEGYRRSHGTLPYVFLCRTQPTTNTAATYHSPMMLLPRKCGTTTNLAWRLPGQWL